MPEYRLVETPKVHGYDFVAGQQVFCAVFIEIAGAVSVFFHARSFEDIA